MLRQFTAGLLASAAFLAPLQAIAQEGSADDLGVMSISLKDVVKPTFGFQGALQGAGTPNQAGIGVLLINVEGRQGRGGRTHLVSPGMAIAAAITGRLTDVRKI